jgi:hypothetical protein
MKGYYTMRFKTKREDEQAVRRDLIVCSPGYDKQGMTDAGFWFGVLGPDLERDPAEVFTFLRGRDKPEGEQR